MTDLTRTVSTYYAARKLKQPNATEALLWLVSELGELAEAHLLAVGLPFPERFALRAVLWVGKLAERVVKGKGGWIRNHGRKTDHLRERWERVEDEVGDMLMMLTVYANQEGCEPEGCMRRKFAKKGVRLGDDPQSSQRDPGPI